MDTRKEINKHLIAIKILEGIKAFQNRIEMNNNTINTYLGSFPNLRNRIINNINIQNKCIDRLTLKYNKLIQDITKL